MINNSTTGQLFSKLTHLATEILCQDKLDVAYMYNLMLRVIFVWVD